MLGFRWGARRKAGMQLHQHGVDLVVKLLEAAEHAESLSVSDTQRLFRETADVLADLLKRDIPEERGGSATQSVQFRPSDLP